MRNRFETLHVVIGFCGYLLLVLGAILLLPLLLVFLDGELQKGPLTLLAFVIPSTFAFLAGIVLKRFTKGGSPDGLQSMLVCTTAWLLFSLIGAVPFMIALRASFIDSFFETMSGFTTTGITMFTGLDSLPKSVLFWRALTQWVGGLGILTFFLAVVFRRESDHRLFGAESHKFDIGRPVPGMANTVKIFWGIYTLFTLLICLGLILAGTSAFDGVCHAFTALSTGGFSPHDSSIEYYRLAGYRHWMLIDYIIILGMMMGGINFLIHYRLLTGNARALIDNTEMRYWWGFIAIFGVLIFAERLFKVAPLSLFSLGEAGALKDLEATFRTVLFQVTAILTTTGFSTRDIAGPYFGPVARQLFLVMMFIGGCVGSTGGGFKMLRVAIMVKSVRRQVFRVRTPRSSISNISIDGKVIPIEELRRVTALFFAWIALLAAGGVVTAIFSNLDGYSSFSGIFSALGNIGPCYIPVSVMGKLHPLIKLTYIFGMLAGRLEIIPVLLFVSPMAWRG